MLCVYLNSQLKTELLEPNQSITIITWFNFILQELK